MKKTALIDKYKAAIKKIIERDPEHTSDWVIDEGENGVGIEIPKVNPEGFDIEIDCNERDIIVFSKYLAHQHFDSPSVEQNIEEAFGFVLDLLSPAMRLRVLRRKGKISRAAFQTKVNGVWKNEGITGLFSLAFFFKNEESFYINRRFPDRMNRVGGENGEQ